MLKKITKYFSLVLILVLINSNYSFALQFMACKMDITKDACECEHKASSVETEIYQKDGNCCKVEIKEINNTNILDTYKTSLDKKISFTTVYYSEQLNRYYSCNADCHLLLLTFKPPTDIPILFSHILI